MSKVALVGAGPGDVGLLTLKARELIEKADCIVYDRLISSSILNFAQNECELIYVGKENHKHVISQDKINDLLVRKACEYNLVVRLKGGDPYVFGRGGEEALYLKEHGIDVEVISGVTSPISVLAAAGIPITQRGVAKGFQVITAHSKNDDLSTIDFSQLLEEDVTLVFLMGLSHVSAIANGLMEAGRSPETKSAVISNGTTSKQKKCIGELSNIAELVDDAELESPAIIVVGEVVGLADKLDFFESRPLFGTRVIVPYITGFAFDYKTGIKKDIENKLINSLLEQGAEVEALSIGKIIPINHMLSDDSLKKYSWIIFTSANAVHSLMYNLKINGLDTRSLSNSKIAAVGSKTAFALEEFALKPDFIPKVHTASDLALNLSKMLDVSDNVLYVAARENSGDIENILKNICNLVTDFYYENQECDFELLDLDASYICFSSASAVKRVAKKIELRPDTKIISIGKSTTQEILNQGYNKYIQAKDTSYEGILQAILNDQ